LNLIATSLCHLQHGKPNPKHLTELHLASISETATASPFLKSLF
ncbi:MAG: hypothetical protein ACI9QV_001508, partial [Methylophagaceae bacterium]